MKPQLTACICIALTQTCFSDKTLFTCKGGTSHAYVAEGGMNKPGWSTFTMPNVVIKLIHLSKITPNGSVNDIQETTEHGTFSAIGDGCYVEEKLDANLSS